MMNMISKKRKNENKGDNSVGSDASAPIKKLKKEKGESQQTSTGASFKKAKIDKKDAGKNRARNGDGEQKPGFAKKKQCKKAPNMQRKKQLSGIVSEAKANYQLFTDKKMEKKEKHVLMDSTYELVKDHIPELSRIKGMGKIIASLLSNRKDIQRASHIQNCFNTMESKLLLMKSNGYKIAVKLIKIGNTKTVSEFVEACLSNGKGVRALMADFKSARVLCAAYEHGNADSKKRILGKLVLGNMPLSADDAPLSDVFSKCKKDVVEGCKIFLQSTVVSNEKYMQHEIIQDVLVVCLQTHKQTGMEVDEFVTIASGQILTLCKRATNCSLALWVVWLATAQMRKQIMKSIKGQVVSLLHTYNGRMFLIGLLESTDDTKALEKFVLKELVDSLEEMVLNDDVRKLLEFILLPRSTKFMHPHDIQILRLGDDVRTSKKSDDARFEEIRKTLEKPVLSALKNNCENWLKDNKLCLLVIAIVERFKVTLNSSLLTKISGTLQSAEFSERVSDKAVRMVLESLLSADISRHEENPEADVFINDFVPNLGETHISNLVSKCPRLIVRLIETASKLENILAFKRKKSWLSSAPAQKAVNEWKHQEDAPRSKNKKGKNMEEKTGNKKKQKVNPK